MITFFNRKELLVTADAQRAAAVEAVLKENHIACLLRTEDIQGGNSLGADRVRGLPGVRRQWMYRIYVKKDAFEYALYLIRNRSVL